jgi:hypothetical protein
MSLEMPMVSAKRQYLAVSIQLPKTLVYIYNYNATAILPRGFSLLKWFICDLRVVMSSLSVKKNICV